MATFSYTPSFPATEQSEPKVRTTSFGDGYRQSIQLGLQRDPKNWVLTFSNRTDTERFDWTPPRGSAGKFICSKWTVQMPNFNKNTVRATFEEVFEP